MFDTTIPRFSARDIQQYLKSFFPASSEAEKFPKLTLECAERFPHALNELQNLLIGSPELVDVTSFNRESVIAERLKQRFNYYGTDKVGHQYHLIYGEIISRLGVEEPLNILEIGLGSQNTNVVSHMTKQFRPGASIRAFRDVASNSMIYGADIDPDVLFTENRIQTAYVDQMAPSSFIEMNNKFSNIKYDLIIDDGLHAVSPNLNTLLFGIGALKAGGWLVIEDIWNGIVCWNTIYHLIPEDKFEKHLISFKLEKRVFAIKKLKA